MEFDQTPSSLKISASPLGKNIRGIKLKKLTLLDGV
jgi:hypothetical protein